MYDIIIIGAGPAGYVAAIRAAQLGAKVLLAEKGRYGGTCLNKGCIPMKSLLHSGKEYAQYFRFASEHKLPPGMPLRLDESADEKKNLTVAALTGGVQSLLKANGVECVEEQAVILEPGTIQTESGRVFESRSVIIAAGTRIAPFPFKIYDDSRLWTSDTMFEKFVIPRKLTIIGGGVIGTEAAQCFCNFGTEVTILEYQERILPMFSEKVSETIAEVFQEAGVKIHCGCKVESVNKGEVVYIQDGTVHMAESDYVFTATGRMPDIDTAMLDKLGIRHNKGFIETDAYMRTNVPEIYAAGDVNGKYMLAHVASAEGIIAAEHIMGLEREMSYSCIPQCIYTDIEVGSCGLQEQQLLQERKKYKKSTFLLGANGKALAEGSKTGFIEILSDETYGEIYGAVIVSPKATELIHILSVAMQGEITVNELSAYIFAHPTLSEIVSEAAKGATTGFIHCLNN